MEMPIFHPASQPNDWLPIKTCPHCCCLEQNGYLVDILTVANCNLEISICCWIQLRDELRHTNFHQTVSSSPIPIVWIILPKDSQTSGTKRDRKEYQFQVGCLRHSNLSIYFSSHLTSCQLNSTPGAVIYFRSASCTLSNISISFTNFSLAVCVFGVGMSLYHPRPADCVTSKPLVCATLSRSLSCGFYKIDDLGFILKHCQTGQAHISRILMVNVLRRKY